MFFFFKQKTADEMRISDWSSDVCSSDLFIGKGARWMIERGFQAADAPLSADRLEPLFARFLARYEAHIADESRPFPGVVAALETLRGEGAKLVVRSEERRVGKERGSTCRSRWSPYL